MADGSWHGVSRIMYRSAELCSLLTTALIGTLLVAGVSLPVSLVAGGAALLTMTSVPRRPPERRRLDGSPLVRPETETPPSTRHLHHGKADVPHSADPPEVAVVERISELCDPVLVVGDDSRVLAASAGALTLLHVEVGSPVEDVVPLLPVARPGSFDTDDHPLARARLGLRVQQFPVRIEIGGRPVAAAVSARRTRIDGQPAVILRLEVAGGLRENSTAARAVEAGKPLETASGV